MFICEVGLWDVAVQVNGLPHEEPVENFIEASNLYSLCQLAGPLCRHNIARLAKGMHLSSRQSSRRARV